MYKKYFIYISSSRDDLKNERRDLIRIVTELGAIPVTMDAFDITNERDQIIIGKVIGECDYFLNLTAYKGGELVGKTSALETEYSMAIKAGVPVLALLIGEKARWKASKKEKDAAAAKALAAFKKKLASHVHDTWASSNEIGQKALSLLSREMNLNPRRGWVPSEMAVDASVANELARLIRENELLRSQFGTDGKDFMKKVRDQIEQTLKVLATNRIMLGFYYVNGENWENPKPFRYIKLFRLLAPELSTPKTAFDISHFLGNILNPDLGKTVRKDFPTPSNTIKKIMADFVLLKLVKCTGLGDNEAWDLTEYGKETFAVHRLHQMTSKKNPQKARKEEPGKIDMV